ncbi:PTS transporter subunit EIIC, partial [Streptomyces rubiginosohelvolus]
LFPLLDGNHGLGATIAIYAGGLVVGYLAGFLATYFFGFSKELLAEFNVSQEKAAPTATPDPATPSETAQAPATV